MKSPLAPETSGLPAAAARTKPNSVQAAPPGSVRVHPAPEAEQAYAEQAQIDNPERAERDGNRDDVEGFKRWINDGRERSQTANGQSQCVDHGCIHQMWLGTYGGWRPGILPWLKLPAGLMRINECKREWFALW